MCQKADPRGTQQQRGRVFLCRPQPGSSGGSVALAHAARRMTANCAAPPGVWWWLRVHWVEARLPDVTVTGSLGVALFTTRD